MYSNPIVALAASATRPLTATAVRPVTELSLLGLHACMDSRRKRQRTAATPASTTTDSAAVDSTWNAANDPYKRVAHMLA